MIRKNLAYVLSIIAWYIFIFYSSVEYNFSDIHSFDLIPVINFSEIPYLKYVIIILFAILIIPLRYYIFMFREKNNFILILLIVSLLIIGYISAFFSEHQDKAFSVCNRALFYVIIFFISIAAVRYFIGLHKIILNSFVYINIFIIIVSLLDFYVPAVYHILVKHFSRPEAFHSYIKVGDNQIMRPMGILTDSNLTAFSVGLSLILLLLNYKYFNKYFRYGFYITGSYIFGMLISRASLIMCCIFLVVFFLFKLGEKKELFIFISLFIIFQIITPQTYGRIISYFDKQKIEEEFSVGRPVIWNAAFSVFRNNPVIGAGPGVFFELSDEYIRDILKDNPEINIDNPYKEKYHKIDKLNPHNIFLAMLAETGIAGLFIFLLLIIFLMINYLKKKNYISFLFSAGILFVSSLSNFAPYYKFYMVICILFYIISDYNLKIETMRQDVKISGSI